MKRLWTRSSWIGASMWAMIVMGGCLQTLQAQVPTAAAPQVQEKAIECPRTTADAYNIGQLYKNGQFGAITQLSDCVLALFYATKPSENPSLELLTATENFLHHYALSCLAQNMPEKAEEATMLLLQRFPRHKINPSLDPPQFRVLLDSLVPYGANHVGLYVGGNLSWIQSFSPVPVRTDITPGNDTVVGPVTYNLPRYDFGFTWQHHFGFRHSWVVGLGINSMAYSTKYVSGKFQRSHGEDGDWMLRQYEKYTFLQLPVNYQYRFPLARHNTQRRLWIALEAGGYANFLLHAETEMLTSTWKDSNGQPVESKARTTIASPYQRRNPLTGGITAGLSFQADYGLVSFFVRASGQFNLFHMRRTGTEYHETIQLYIWQYDIVDQNFKLHSMQLTVGVLLPRSHKVKNFRKS